MSDDAPVPVDHDERRGEVGFQPGQRRRIYDLTPSTHMVRAFQRSGPAANDLTDDEVRAGLAATLNPAVETMDCGGGLLEWRRGPNGYEVLGHQRCALDSDHHGQHITKDGLHVWADSDDEEDEQ